MDAILNCGASPSPSDEGVDPKPGNTPSHNVSPAPVKVFETPMSIRNSEESIQALFESLGPVDSVSVTAVKRTACVQFRHASAIKALMGKIMQFEARSSHSVPLSITISPNEGEATEENGTTERDETVASTTTTLHKFRGYVFFGYYRVLVEGEFRDMDAHLPSLLFDEEKEQDVVWRKKRSREEECEDGKVPSIVASNMPQPEILVMTFVPLLDWTGYRGAPAQRPQPLAVTPFIIYQALRGVTFPKRIIVLPTKGGDATTGTQRALVQIDTLEQAMAVHDAFHRLTLELMDRDGLRAKFLVYVKDPRNEGGEDAKRQHVLNVAVNTAQALCVTPAAVSHLGAIFQRNSGGLGDAISSLPYAGGVLEQRVAELGPADQGSASSSLLDASASSRSTLPAVVTVTQSRHNEQHGDSRPRTVMMPAGWSTAYSSEHRREYYVYECPRTGVQRSSWTLPEL
jgi:hypothetical protein